MTLRPQPGLHYKHRARGLERQKPDTVRVVIGVIIAPAVGPICMAALAAAVMSLDLTSWTNAVAISILAFAPIGAILGYPLILLVLPLYIHLSDRVYVRFSLCGLVGGIAGIVFSFIPFIIIALSDWPLNYSILVAGLLFGIAIAWVFWLIVLADVRLLLTKLKPAP